MQYIFRQIKSIANLDQCSSHGYCQRFPRCDSRNAEKGYRLTKDPIWLHNYMKHFIIMGSIRCMIYWTILHITIKMVGLFVTRRWYRWLVAVAATFMYFFLVSSLNWVIVWLHWLTHVRCDVVWWARSTVTLCMRCLWAWDCRVNQFMYDLFFLFPLHLFY